MCDFELSALAAFMIFIFVGSSFWPFGYAAPATTQPAANKVSPNVESGLHSVLTFSSKGSANVQPASTLELASGGVTLLPLELTSSKSSSAACAKRVQTEQLTWEEYYSLLAAGANGSIDAFGDLAAYERQQNYDDADLAEEGSVNSVKDQFVITNQGKTVMLFDALKHRFVSPNDAGCYLSRIVANGRMSYTTEVDLNTRVCSEYYTTGSGEQCAYGHLSEPSSKSLEAVSKKSKTLLDAYNELSKDSPDYSKVKKTLDDICLPLTIPPSDCGDYSKLIREQKKADLQKQIMKIAGASNISQFGENPVNIVTSNKTTAQLEQVNDGQVWMFPVWLVFLLQYIQNQEGNENWYMAASWGPMIIGLASLKSPGATAGKAVHTAGGLEKALTLGEKAAKWLGKLKTWGKVWKAEKVAEGVGEVSETTLRSPQVIAEIAESKSDDLARELQAEFVGSSVLNRFPPRVSADDVTEIFVTASKGTVNDVRAAADIEVGAVKSGDVIEAMFKEYGASYSPTLTIGDLRNPAQVDKTIGFLNYVKGTGIPANVKHADKLLGNVEIIKQLPAEKRVEALAAALDSKVLSGIKGEKILTETLEDAYLKIPGSAQKMSEYRTAFQNADFMRQDWWKFLFKMQGLRALALLRGAERNIYLGRAFMLVDFAFTHFFTQPVPVYVARGMRFELQPQSRAIGDEPSYLEVGKLSTTVSPDVLPRDFFSALFKFMNIDLKAVFGAEMNPVNYKMQNIGDYVAVVDQETPAAMYAKKPHNFINPTADGKWSFLNLNPDATDMYQFEHPDAYYQTGGNKYTAMALVSRNLNTSSIVVESDLATFGPATALHAIIPSSDWWAVFTVVGGAIDFVGGLPGRGLAARRGLGFIATWWLAQQLAGNTVGELGQTAEELKIGSAVNLAEAFKSGELCKDVEKRMEEDIGAQAMGMWVSLGVNYVTSTVATAAMVTGVGVPVAAGALLADIVVSYMNMRYTEAYQEAKETALDEMKQCKETEFKIFAWGKIPTDAGEKDLLTQSLQDLGKGVAGTLGPVLDAVSPDIKQALDSIAANTYHNTLMLRSAVSGQSLVNLFGTQVYQVHFDPETDINWMLGSAVTADGAACPLNLCYEQSDGSFKCLTARGYELRDRYGNLLLNSSLVLGAHWNNLEEYFGIPQKVINVNNTGALGGEVLLEFDGDKRVVDKCTEDEIKAMTKTTDFRTIFGDFIGAYTDKAMVWKDGNSTSIRFFEETGEYGEAQIVTIPYAKTTLYKSGKIIISGEGKSIELNMRPATDDYMIFSNAKITPGKAVPYLNTLHVILRVLMTFNIKQAQDYDLLGVCTDPETGKKIIGMKFGLDLTNPNDEARANQLLQDICFTDIRGINDERISIKDNKVCVTDINDNTVCYDLESYDSATNSLVLKDPETGKEYRMVLERGPNGEPQFVIRDENGNTVGAPIPLLWATGMGGSMMYDSKTGQISIKNEFPFAINPNFGIYGAGGSGMMFPQTSLTGGKPREPTTTPTGAPSPFAALPGIPTDFAGAALFAAALLAGLLAVRARYSHSHSSKRGKRSTP